MKIVPVVPPSSFGGVVADCGKGSDSITCESPIFSSACAILPSGPCMRSVSSAPNAFL